MKQSALALVLALGLLSPIALADDTDLATACVQAIENGDIELPDGMATETAKEICVCMGEKASEDIAEEVKASLATYDLAERMSALSEDAAALFGQCAEQSSLLIKRFEVGHATHGRHHRRRARRRAAV